MFKGKNLQMLKGTIVFVLSFVSTVNLASLAKKQEVLFSPIFLNEGIGFYRNGDVKNAISSFNKSLSLSQTDITTLLLLANAYVEDNKLDQAIKILQNSSKAYPGDSLLHFLLGRGYEQNKKLKEALSEYKVASELEPENILIKYELGKAYFFSGDYKSSVDNFGKVILAYPLHLPSRVLLAASYHQLKKYALAKEQYRIVLDYLPGNASVWYNLAKAEIALGEFDDAKQSINQAILLDNSVVEFYLDRAQLNYRLSSLSDADTDYLTALKLEPGNPVIPVEYGNFLWKTSAYEKAAEQYKIAIELQPDDNELLINRAYLLQLAKNYTESAEIWNEVLLDEPDNEYALFNLAAIYKEQGEYENAIDLYKKLISLEGIAKDNLLDGRKELASCFYKNKDFSEAKALYSELMKEEPENPEISYEYGTILLEEKDYKSAVDTFKKAAEYKYEPLKMVYQSLVSAYENLNGVEDLKVAYKEWLSVDKDNVDARIAYAKFLAKNGSTQEAIEQYRVASALDNTSASKFKLAQFLTEQKDFYGAVGQLQEYLQAFPEDLNALILLADSFKELGINEQAINTYKKIISLQPDNYLIQFNLGLLYQMEKKSDEAQNYLLKAIELNENYAPAYYALGLSYMSSGDLKSSKAKELFEKYLQLEPNGEYRDKIEVFLKDILSKPASEGSKV